MSWILFFAFILFNSAATVSSPVFKIGIYASPRSLDPQLQTSSTSYLFHNLYRNLFYYHGDGRLEKDMAEKCVRKNKGKVLHCWLKKDLKWNQGAPLTSQDFLSTYQRILAPESKAQRPDFLFPILNAKEIYEGQKPMKSLGVKTPSPQELVFEFEKPDEEFEYNLASFYLSPIKGSYEIKDGGTYFTNGPYQIKKIHPGKNVLVTSNPYYPHSSQRPDVEFFLIEEDSVGLRLYDKGELHWVRRIPTLLQSKYKKRPDFHEVPALRFDYIAFMGPLKENLEARKALAHSLNYPEWQSLLFSIGRPGCPGLPESWFSKTMPCYELQKSKAPEGIKLQYVYSQQGGDDHRRTAEWLQAQWKKNLGIQVQVRGMENKSFVAELKSNPPPIYRKGLAPDRPTCSAVMENFTSDHPENYIQQKDPEFDALTDKLRQTANVSEKQKICETLVSKLMSNYKLIPTGRYNLAFLVSPKFTGWKLNELNQLDLTLLKAETVK